jgi:hypothetical protein
VDSESGADTFKFSLVPETDVPVSGREANPASFGSLALGQAAEACRERVDEPRCQFSLRYRSVTVSMTVSKLSMSHWANDSGKAKANRTRMHTRRRQPSGEES